MTQSIAIMCAAIAAMSAAFSAVSDHEIRLTASSHAAKSTNEYIAVSQNSNSRSVEEASPPRFDGLRFIETLVTAHR